MPLPFRLLVLLLTCVVVACSTPYGKPSIEPENSNFDGFLVYPKSRVLMIHGMCHHDENWFKETLTHLKSQYGLDGEIRLDPVWTSSPGGVELYESTLTGHGRTVSFFGIVYSNLTLPLKRQYLCPDVSKPTESCPQEVLQYSRTRARLNASLKDQLMNDCLADAVIYLGETGESIRNGVWKAFERAAERSAPQPGELGTPLFLVSESLGSKVLSDSLACNTGIESETFTNALASTTHFFLLANQIPLLNTGFLPEDCQDRPMAESLKAKVGPTRDVSTLDILIEMIRERKMEYGPSVEEFTPIRQPIKLIAFTDPNDLLSYELRHEDVSFEKLINIVLSNSPTWFGIIESPVKAHLGYGVNESVVAYMACGKRTENTNPQDRSICLSTMPK